MKCKPTINNLDCAVSFFEKQLEQVKAPQKIIAQVNIAVDEIFSNIVKYSRATEIILECEICPNKVIMRFIDDGIRFNPILSKEPDVSEDIEMRAIGGLGIFLVKKNMSHMAYQYADGKNILTLEKQW